jgi:hypothetical protein
MRSSRLEVLFPHLTAAEYSVESEASDTYNCTVVQ